MSDSIVTLHVVVRWLILVSAVAAIVAILMARRGAGWNTTAHFWTQAYAWLMGIQSIIGVALWLSEDRWEGGNVFLSFIHPAVMLVAVGIAHGGLAHAYRQQDPQRTSRQALITVVVSFAIVLVTIPWFIHD
jgi:hypothetical protein